MEAEAEAGKKRRIKMAKTFYTNGTILTMKENSLYAEAVCVKDGQIYSVGTEEEVMAEKEAGDQVINLNGSTMMPGFIDAHSHFVGAANAMLQCDLSFCESFKDIVKEMKKLVDSGELGEVLSVQATNHVPYGSVYYHSWYRDDSLTGGLFLQKSTHDMDYITYILGKRPVSVVAKTAKMYFKGEKEAGLCCEDCSEYHTCPESSFVVKTERKEEPTGKYCCFAKDTGNEDVGAAIFTCEDGTIISYHQTFFVKNNAGRRGARFIGSKASAEFDFYTAKLRVDYYDTKHSAEHRFTYPEGLVHFGGDEQLAKAYVDVLEGKESRSDLCAGLASAAACLAAKKAAENGKEEHVFYGF